ncbi:hypothetical protein [Deinococcus hohokamensis]|uniref:Uncharacterized protein n=1 Tax=Deinococcus hohokamensis TaxID=309883 RepID=A0ABV9I871_9DEIO
MTATEILQPTVPAFDPAAERHRALLHAAASELAAPSAGATTAKA